jgi:hypothetical protein
MHTNLSDWLIESLPTSDKADMKPHRQSHLCTTKPVVYYRFTTAMLEESGEQLEDQSDDLSIIATNTFDWHSILCKNKELRVRRYAQMSSSK